MERSAKLTKVNTSKIHRCFSDIGCFKGTFLLQLKGGMRPNQAPPLSSCQNETVWLCLNPAWLNHILIKAVHRGPIINDILPKLTHVWYLTLKDASPHYHNLKLDQKSYLTTFACQFSRYRYAILAFGTVPAGDIFQQKKNRKNIQEHAKSICHCRWHFHCRIWLKWLWS